MSSLRTRACVFAATLVATGAAAGPAHAVTWSPVPSGTTSEITAIEYQGGDRFWFTTASGAIFKRQSGSFTQVRPANAVRLDDIEFQDGGQVGFAVGANGTVLRSVDGGTTWNAVTGIPVSKRAASASTPDCTATEPLGAVNAVRFAGDGRAWIFAEGSQIAKSEPVVAGNVGATGTWVDANRDTRGTADAADDVCKANKSGTLYNDGLAGGVFAAANPDVGWILNGSYARVFSFTDDLATQAMLQAEDAGNSGGNARVLAGDPDDPTRQWSVNRAPYGISTTGRTEDGWATSATWNVANPTARAFTQNGPYDVDYRGGTVLAAGDAGMILASVNGRDFSYVDDAALPAQDWRAVGVASGSAGAVGGTGGTLIVSSDAATLPAPPATGGGTGSGTGGTTTPVTTTPPATTPPATTPVKPTLPGATQPPLAGKAATVKGKYVVFRVKGRLGVPVGVNRRAACSGTMSLSVYKGKRRLKSATTKLTSTCGYSRTVKVKRTKVGKAKRLKLKVAFRGNAVLGKLSSTYAVKVKR